MVVLLQRRWNLPSNIIMFDMGYKMRDRPPSLRGDTSFPSPLILPFVYPPIPLLFLGILLIITLTLKMLYSVLET